MSLFSDHEAMIRPHDPAWAMRADLRAQLAPLDRYGMVGPIAAAVSGLRALVRALSQALCQALRQAPGASARCCGCEA